MSSFFFYTCLGNFFSSFFFTSLLYTQHAPAYPHSSWYECLVGETGINHALSSGIWDGKNAVSTIGNEVVNEWTDSGKWDGRKSVNVGNGVGSEWADSGTGSGTGTVYLAVGRETREQKSVTGEVGKHRSGKEIS